MNVLVTLNLTFASKFFFNLHLQIWWQSCPIEIPISSWLLTSHMPLKIFLLHYVVIVYVLFTHLSTQDMHILLADPHYKSHIAICILQTVSYASVLSKLTLWGKTNTMVYYYPYQAVITHPIIFDLSREFNHCRCLLQRDFKYIA